MCIIELFKENHERFHCKILQELRQHADVDLASLPRYDGGWCRSQHLRVVELQEDLEWRILIIPTSFEETVRTTRTISFSVFTTVIIELPKENT